MQRRCPACEGHTEVVTKLLAAANAEANHATPMRRLLVYRRRQIGRRRPAPLLLRRAPNVVTFVAADTYGALATHGHDVRGSSDDNWTPLHHLEVLAERALALLRDGRRRPRPGRR